MLGEIIEFLLYHKTNKEDLTVLCSVVKHLRSGRALKKWVRLVFSPTLLSCSTASCVLYNRTEHRAQSRLLYLLICIAKKGAHFLLKNV